METNEYDEVIVDDEEETNEEVEEVSEEAPKKEKAKRTPQEELEYFEGRANRLRKKLGLDEEKSEPKKSTNSDKPGEFTDGQLAILRADGIKRKEEVALAQEYVNTGKKLLDVLENKHFLNDLRDLREARESTDALPKGKGRSAQSGVTDIDLAYEKFKETGEWPSDYDTAVKLKNKITETEKGPSSIFK